MDAIKRAIGAMIDISEDEMQAFLSLCHLKTFKKQEIISPANRIPQEIYFLNSGLLRVLIRDSEGNEHSTHFAMENEFIADYSSFLQQKETQVCLEALEETEAVILPRAAIEWGYAHLKEGQKLGRLIAEHYFIYQDYRITNLYVRTAKERYESITELFPNIHNRVPQHMIASYLGITPVHLSRLKKENFVVKK